MPAENGDRHMRESGKAQCVRGRGRQIDNPAVNERPAIVDPHYHGAAVTVIGDAHHGAERQTAMRGREARRPRVAALSGAPP